MMDQEGLINLVKYESSHPNINNLWSVFVLEAVGNAVILDKKVYDNYADYLVEFCIGWIGSGKVAYVYDGEVD